MTVMIERDPKSDLNDLGYSIGVEMASNNPDAPEFDYLTFVPPEYQDSKLFLDGFEEGWDHTRIVMLSGKPIGSDPEDWTEADKEQSRIISEEYYQRKMVHHAKVTGTNYGLQFAKSESAPLGVDQGLQTLYTYFAGMASEEENIVTEFLADPNLKSELATSFREAYEQQFPPNPNP